MPKKFETGRVILDESAKLDTEHMLTDLKKLETCISISPSKLVSWIVKNYRQTNFEKNRDSIVKAHFNTKEYLRKTVNASGSQEELTNALEAVLEKMRQQDQSPVRVRKKSVLFDKVEGSLQGTGNEKE